MSDAKVVSYRPKGSQLQWRSGAYANGCIIDGSDLGWPESVRRLLELRGGGLTEALTSAQVGTTSVRIPSDQVELGPPVPDPQKIIGVGFNYRTHAVEAGHEVPEFPELFAKFPNCLIGNDSPIEVPEVTSQVDYEVELAVFIGKRSRQLSAGEAIDAIAGYSVMNDVSARDLQFAVSQWTAGKVVDTFAPIGPGITPRQNITDVQSLELSTWINGKRMQFGNTKHMVYSVATLIAYITSFMTLEPGDIISTGTPDGIGMARVPPVYLQPGDLVEVAVQHVGRISNPIVRVGNASQNAVSK